MDGLQERQLVTREPSDRMIERGYDALSVEWDMSHIDPQEMCAAVRRIWQAMYDEAA